MDNIQQSSLDDHLNDSLELKFEACFYCNGYYGPCHGEPVCGVCHDFIFSDDFASCRQVVRPESDIGKDDGDSGNDEPSEDSAPLPSFHVDASNNPPDYLMAAVPWNPRDSPQSSNQVSPSDRLAKRVTQLTTHISSPQETSNRDNSHRIPPEIWAIIFRMLDDISLFMASKVSPRWKTIITDQYPNGRWEEFVKKRWRLFNPIYTTNDWYSVYSDFLESVPCKHCFMDLNSVLPVPTGPGSAIRSNRLDKEIKLMRCDHPEGIEAVPLDNLNYNWLARVNGPPQSPYQGGVFYLNLKISHDYPLKPPGVRFLTKIFHPNISRHGDIGIDCIQHNWTLALTIPQILLSVQSLLTDPFLEISMEKGVAELYEKDRQTFEKIARIWTWKYAMHDVLLH